MKRLLLSALALIALASCQRTEEVNSTSLRELTRNDVSFVNFSKVLTDKNLMTGNVESKIDGGGAGFSFILGRQSRNCNGFGVCEVTAFWIEIYTRSVNSDKLARSTDKFTGLITKSSSTVGELNDSEYCALLVLENKIDETKFNTSFTVDKDVYVEDKYVIKRGVYPLDKSIGENGGYKLDVVKL
ncbi:hypothetical protein [Riemerella anatipestifer]|uniref:Lipoprotein n=1 Tax=Riemerella anatipestifer RA-CH-1 TaxID=1228997 RepID=J9R2A4_RIEAN|nr:hypothetical protein [Riemerella anatipestifer]AFR35934.1 hypothetical protein B739_1336 [Riemerella anatipestifer RA-CH-1]AIH02932.1 hypothetical protein M949_1765 [Riemerella anatipestifer CH3]MBT0572738.1 hypothetical protein [Riemerella anatipestifer]MCO7331077.1 hypothetical protein [Riemerella anatipestifer]MCO7349873.1 hypothetical protein [Riemerella anatipestifer]